jgi:hypothetical protein
LIDRYRSSMASFIDRVAGGRAMLAFEGDARSLGSRSRSRETEGDRFEKLPRLDETVVLMVVKETSEPSRRRCKCQP